MNSVNDRPQQFVDWNGLDVNPVNFGLTGEGLDIRCNGVEPFRVAGELWTFDHAILRQRPADELHAPGEFFPIMNAEVDSLVHADEQDNTVFLCHGCNGSIRIMDGLRIDDIVRADASEG